MMTDLPPPPKKKEKKKTTTEIRTNTKENPLSQHLRTTGG